MRFANVIRKMGNQPRMGGTDRNTGLPLPVESSPVNRVVPDASIESDSTHGDIFVQGFRPSADRPETRATEEMNNSRLSVVSIVDEDLAPWRDKTDEPMQSKTMVENKSPADAVLSPAAALITSSISNPVFTSEFVEQAVSPETEAPASHDFRNTNIIKEENTSPVSNNASPSAFDARIAGSHALDSGSSSAVISESSPPVAPANSPDSNDKFKEQDEVLALWLHLRSGLDENLLGSVSGVAGRDASAVMAIADQLLDSLLQGNALIRMLFVEKKSDDLASHLLDLAVVATRMGIVLGYERKDLRELALSAMLHDIGMLRVPAEVVKKQSGLSEGDLVEIRRHPIYSADILSKMGLPDIVVEVARQVHEKDDGSGYPRGLRGDDIHEYAKIVAMADTYTAMLQPRPQRERMMPFEIVKEIIEQGQGHFSRRLVKTLIDEFAIFPVGLYVRLNTGEVAIVKKSSRLSPLRPEVTVVMDGRGRRLPEPKEYNLMREPLLAVVDSSFEPDSRFFDQGQRDPLGDPQR